jgi:Sulfotransferase family
MRTLAPPPRTAAPPVRYTFVGGTGRCGSSLVQELLACHPGVGFVSNLDDLSPLRSLGSSNNAIFARVPQAWRRKGRIRFAPSEGWRSLAREVSPLVCEPGRDLTAADVTPWLANRFRAYFEDRAAAQHKPAFMHKFTGWPRYGFVEAVLPGSRFVHLVRDGRAVVSSWLQMPWWRGHLGPAGWHFGTLPPAYAEEWAASGESYVILAALAWKLLLDAFDDASAKLAPDQHLVIRYEDLIADPHATLDRLRAFAGLDGSPALDRAVAAARLTPERRAAWRDQLTPEQVALLDRSLAAHLARYGYPT